MFKTKDASHIVGISKRTLQYYDDLGLINVKRDNNYHRIYDEEMLGKLQMIQLLKQAEFTLEEIKVLINLPNEQLEKKLNEKFISINEEIEEMETSKNLINWIKDNGFTLPNSNSNDSYVKQIEQLKNNLKHKEDK